MVEIAALKTNYLQDGIKKAIQDINIDLLSHATCDHFKKRIQKCANLRGKIVEDANE